MVRSAETVAAGDLPNRTGPNGLSSAREVGRFIVIGLFDPLREVAGRSAASAEVQVSAEDDGMNFGGTPS